MLLKFEIIDYPVARPVCRPASLARPAQQEKIMSSALSTHPACGCIDVHHHHGTLEFAQFMANTPSDRAFPPNTWRVEEAPAAMNDAGGRPASLPHVHPYPLSPP